MCTKGWKNFNKPTGKIVAGTKLWHNRYDWWCEEANGVLAEMGSSL
jgi:hypothetical protein